MTLFKIGDNVYFKYTNQYGVITKIDSCIYVKFEGTLKEMSFALNGNAGYFNKNEYIIKI